MKERPILFSAPMVRAILEGQKTQTRRAVKPQPEWTEPASVWAFCEDGRSGPGWYAHNDDYPEEGALFYRCPYGQPGDRLWVRESGWERPWRTAKMMREGADTWPRYAYAADGWDDQDRADFKAWGFKSLPSIHMPRWASRILLEIVSVRVERLQDISEGDAVAEGCETVCMTPTGEDNGSAIYGPDGYAALWDRINGAGAWEANPWVWVIEFKRVTP